MTENMTGQIRLWRNSIEYFIVIEHQIGVGVKCRRIASNNKYYAGYRSLIGEDFILHNSLKV